jgi:dihydropyrimidinase
MTTLIANGIVVSAHGRSRSDVLIEGERIVGVAAAGTHGWETSAERVIDATGKHVIPGGVDAHTHMEIPMGSTYSADDFETGTRAAAWGGTTTIVDFAEQAIGDSLMNGFESRMALAEGRCAIDYGFHMIMSDVNPQSLEEMDLLMREGVNSFKLFMAYPGRLYSTDGQIFAAMQRAAASGGTMMMHAENGIVIDVLREQAVARGDTEPIHHSITRPPQAEAEATHRAIVYAEMAGAPLFVVHMSAKEAVAEVAAARARGSNVFGETCPQYLYLGWDNLREPDFEGAKYVCSPPVRDWEQGHQQALWRYLAAGDLQTVGTDHCPFFFDDDPTKGRQKRLGERDFTLIPNGLPGVEERMRLMYHGAVGEGHLTLERFVDVCCTAPAKMFGLYPRKGAIELGSDADIVVFDPDVRTVVSVDTNHMNVDYSCYESKEVQGKIELVMSRGRVIVENDVYLGAPGDGEFLKRDLCQMLR